ncbi:hypothetical protein L0657_14900 [Dyadobacter sp. CY345]|uniref:hypothetical protein n=1 Tax=Dyadobacter sp. CY345 TaxID=2909335 RepID=UPI001F19B7D0|nr:hypothetical protein [Dyadobacter sp. CY345]MCF2445255.1 hypothetical protein [Dyadobacter sp. CY345]
MNKTDSLLLISIFFGIFGWAIWQLLRYSENTVGKYSPLKISRSYEISAFQYFTKFDNLFFYYIGLGGLYLLSKVPDTFTTSVYLFDWRNSASIIFISLLFLSLPSFYLYLDINYWYRTKNIKLIYYPESKIVEIDFPEKIYTLGEGDIKHIEVISSGGKIQFGYSIYSLKNGESFILTDRVPGTWAIREYFKKILVKFTEKRFPLIKSGSFV